MSAAESQTEGGDDRSHVPPDDGGEVIECYPSGHVDGGSVAFSPDDKLISYFVSKEGTLAPHIFGFDLALREERLLSTLPVEEEVKEAQEEEDEVSSTEKRRGRRLVGKRGLRYEWATGASGSTLMVPLPDGIFVQDEQAAELRLRVASTAASPVLNPQLSPDGRSIAYVRDDKIYVTPTIGGEEIQITSGAREAGKDEDCSPSDSMDALISWNETSRAHQFRQDRWECRRGGTGIILTTAPSIQGQTDSRSGFWWSPDSMQIAFSEGDPSRVPSSPPGENGDANVLAEPSSGKANVALRLGIVPASGGDVSWVPLLTEGAEHDGEDCLGRVMWLPDGYLVVKVQNRARTKVRLLKFNLSTGKRQVLLVDSLTTPNVPNSFTPLKTGGFIWASDRSGFRHLYLYDAAGECLGPLTKGMWAVERVVGVDETVGIVYFTGSSNPLEVHFYSTLIFPDYSFPIELPKQLTRGVGRHAIAIDHQMQKFVDILDDGAPGSLPRVQVCSLADRRKTSPQLPVNSHADQASPRTPTQRLVHEGFEEVAAEELQRAAAILLKHSSTVCEGLCTGCVPILQKLLTRLALFDTPETTIPQCVVESDTVKQGDCVKESGELVVSHEEYFGEVSGAPVQRDLSRSGTENGVGNTADTAPSADTGVKVSPAGERQARGRLWSEEQSSGSEREEEQQQVPGPHDDSGAGDPEAPQTPAAAAPEPVEFLWVPKAAAPANIQSRTPFNGRALAFHSPNAISNFAWANATLLSPTRVGEEDSSFSSSSAPDHNERVGDVESPSSASKMTRLEQEARRMAAVVRQKDFECVERIRGRLINVVEGLELHKKVVNNVEQQKLVDMVYKFQEMGREGKLRGRTYSEPKKWMPGKGRVTIQFGCCYNYALDKNGNPPGITNEHVDPLPDLLKTTIRRLVRWGVLEEKVVPDSCIINIYDVGDCIPPHIDHHDFLRPFSTLSLLSECNIVFGSKLSIVGDGLFDGPMYLPLPTGSVLVLKGNAADLAKHAVPGVPMKRISITFRKMDPLKTPSWYQLPQDLRGIRTAPHLRRQRWYKRKMKGALLKS